MQAPARGRREIGQSGRTRRMARNRDPFTQALTALRDRIESGVLAGGAPVIVQDEAQRLNLSATPVREALARLSGEGLVERAPAGGYVTMRLDAQGVADRHALHGEYLAFAVRLNVRALGRLSPPPVSGGTSDPATAVRALFSAIVCSAGNRTLWESYERLTRQLDLFRALEPLLFGDLDAESAALHTAYAENLSGAFPEVCAAYHGRRIAAAGPLAALAWKRSEGVPEAVPGQDRSPAGP